MYEEKKNLSNVINRSVSSSRLRYNRVDVPSTYRNLVEAEFTDELRNQFKTSDVGWQQEIGNDENLKSLKGIMAYSNTSPFEVQKEYIRLWKLCEQMVSNEQYDIDVESSHHDEDDDPHYDQIVAQVEEKLSHELDEIVSLLKGNLKDSILQELQDKIKKDSSNE